MMAEAKPSVAESILYACNDSKSKMSWNLEIIEREGHPEAEITMRNAKTGKAFPPYQAQITRTTLEWSTHQGEPAYGYTLDTLQNTLTQKTAYGVFYRYHCEKH